MTDRASRSMTVEPNHRVVAWEKADSVEEEMSGGSKEDVEVVVEHRVLKVTERSFGPHQVGNEDENKNGFTKGRKLVAVYLLQLRLDRGADTENLSSESYKDGLMILKVPSLQKEAVRKVNIK